MIEKYKRVPVTRVETFTTLFPLERREKYREQQELMSMGLKTERIMLAAQYHTDERSLRQAFYRWENESRWLGSLERAPDKYLSWDEAGPTRDAPARGGRLSAISVRVAKGRKNHGMGEVTATYDVPVIVYEVLSDWSHYLGTIPHAGEIFETYMDALREAKQANESPFTIGGQRGFYVSKKYLSKMVPTEEARERAYFDVWDWVREADFEREH